MDLKVYRKEEVKQPSGTEYVLTPNVIDIIPIFSEEKTSGVIKNNTWSLEQLKQVADVSIVDGKLIINSDNVRYENGNLYVTIYEEQLTSCELVETNEEVTEQACALATIWQRGNDPLDLTDGNRWSELYLGEVNVIQIMEDLTESVQEVTPSVTVSFDTVTGADGKSYFSYKLKAVV